MRERLWLSIVSLSLTVAVHPFVSAAAETDTPFRTAASEGGFDPALVGTWTSRGYGWIADIRSDGSAQVYDHSTVACTAEDVPAADLTEIFNEFKRLNKISHVSKTAEASDKGLGLGLSIVERILKQLNIPLSIRSVPNQGSSFLLNVPLAINKPNTIDEEQDDWNTQASVEQQKTVICIDNEIQILEGMQQLLSGWGVKVYGVEGSEQATVLLDNDIKPDLLLVDYQLNDELGTDVVVALFEKYGLQCPVIVVTANHSEALSNELKNAGYHLLLKPLKPIKLRQLFNRLF